jgi:prefoldin subunit 5
MNATLEQLEAHYSELAKTISGLYNMKTPRNSKKARLDIIETIARYNAQLDEIREQIIALEEVK